MVIVPDHGTVGRMEYDCGVHSGDPAVAEQKIVIPTMASRYGPHRERVCGTFPRNTRQNVLSDPTEFDRIYVYHIYNGARISKRQHFAGSF